MNKTFSRSPRNRNRNFRTNRNRFNNNRKRYSKPQSINPDRFINKAVPPKAEKEYEPQYSFSDFGFSQKLRYLIEQKGYQTPTPIQDKTIRPILSGQDVVGLANTGTGKTAAFLLPIIERLLRDKTNLTLVVVPTRELASQINDEFKSFAYGLGLYSAVCVGGVRIGPQIASLRRNPHVVIATPGRLKDLLQNHKMPINKFRIVVLDEVDRMLDMGFVNDIKYFISQLPNPHQSLCFSATITPQISGIINSLSNNAVTFSVRSSETSDQVEQNVIHVSSNEEKMAHLLDLLQKAELQKVLIFGETKHGVQKLSDNLVKHGIKSAAIHGNKSQPQRQRALLSLKDSKIQVLVATDVAARGLDVPDVTHVINYDTPQTYDDYIHRIGRTGRAEKRGYALTFVPHKNC